MPAAKKKPNLKKIASRWHDLAQRRLADYGEMHDSGRWRLFYAGEEEFALNMLEMIKTNNIWARLAGRKEMDELVPAAFPKQTRRRSAA